MTGIADVIVGYRLGPLNLQARGMYTPGNTANQTINGGDDINYYRPINPAFGYMAGWSDIWTGGLADYANAILTGAPGVALRTSPSYGKHGWMFLAAAVDYAITPALMLAGTVNASGTAEKVDTSAVLGANGRTSTAEGRWRQCQLPGYRGLGRHDVPFLSQCGPDSVGFLAVCRQRAGS